MQFKDNESRMVLQYRNEIDPKLRAVLLDIDFWLKTIHNVEMVVTCLNRTAEYNSKIGGRPQSAHLDGRAADIRTWNLGGGVVEELIERTQKVWGDMVHIIQHVGTGPHIHLNINRAFKSPEYSYWTKTKPKEGK